ncbi:MerR family transcriptional regulator [Gracilibacillus alcaliphilus]|uniref:MerR family transcriptional regulator n=1 Tax=Gracilibacillus alcaliphilus TaxID=1401441 RepID=UPI001956D975|nr:MerR family transcriptional regulator [Gracilibacillus alcaliphilus]MBM7679655.1 DNA-binding transcriptional MerR regulator [Gracilibacillus alcaliphilus]
MPTNWKIGELAKLTGLSIRTLRYYDQIGLFSPSEYTASGHRRYTDQDLQRLQQILAFKQMGFSLEDIQQALKKEGRVIVKSIDQQIEHISEEILVQQTLLDQLKRIREALSQKENIAIEELTYLFELMRVDRSKYFTKTQLDQITEAFAANETEKHNANMFKMLLDQLRAKKEAGIPVNDQSVKELAVQWRALTASFSQADSDLTRNAETFYADHPHLALHYGLDADLYSYLKAALANK